MTFDLRSEFVLEKRRVKKIVGIGNIMCKASVGREKEQGKN